MPAIICQRMHHHQRHLINCANKELHHYQTYIYARVPFLDRLPFLKPHYS